MGKIKTIHYCLFNLILIIFFSSILLQADIKQGEDSNSFLNKIIVNIANVRYKPDLKSKIIGRLKKNLLVQVINIDKEWAKISLKGFYFRKERINRPWGFIHKSLIKPTTIKPKEFLGMGSVKIIYKKVNIRKHSNTKSRIIGNTRKGVIFGVLKRDKKWITVIIPELENNKVKKGFIYSPLTKKSSRKPFVFEKEVNISNNTNKNIIITGDIGHDLTLEEGKSYLFSGKVRILKEVKLIINPGVSIDLKNAKLTSEEKLIFKGSLEKPIVIKATSNENQKIFTEILSEKIIFENCIINGNLIIKTQNKASSLKMKDSKFIGNLKILFFKDIEIKGNNLTNSVEGITINGSENISITDSLFFNNKTALNFIKSKNIKIKFNSFFNNITTFISDKELDLSDNFWNGESIENIKKSLKTNNNVIIEPQLLYPSENAPSHLYEHILYPEETDLGDTIELELIFNRDMDQTSIPQIKISSEKHKILSVLNYYEQEWISSRSWFARFKLPKEIKPGRYKIKYTNINSAKSSSPIILKSPKISVLQPVSIKINHFKHEDKNYINLIFSGARIFKILLYRQSEKEGYLLYKKWKYNKDMNKLTIPIEFDKSENWIDFEAFAVNKKDEILAKSEFIRIKAN